MSIYKAELKTRKIQDWTLAACPNIEKNLKWKHKEWKKLKMRKIKPVPVVHILRRIKNERIEKWEKNKNSKNWTCAACPHIGKPHPLDSTDLCRSSSWKHQQSYNFLFLFCLKQAKDIYLHESGRPATDVATERKKTTKPTKPTHFPFLNIVTFTAAPLFDQPAPILKHWDLKQHTRVA